jgi:hypothetical protein
MIFLMVWEMLRLFEFFFVFLVVVDCLLRILLKIVEFGIIFKMISAMVRVESVLT